MTLEEFMAGWNEGKRRVRLKLPDDSTARGYEPEDEVGTLLTSEALDDAVGAGGLIARSSARANEHPALGGHPDCWMINVEVDPPLERGDDGLRECGLEQATWA